jgi:tetratricopeptide (TPR) repeat protein
MVKANEFAAMNLRRGNGYLKIDLSPLQNIHDELKITEGKKMLYSKTVDLKTLTGFSDSVSFNGNPDSLTVSLGDHKMEYKSDPGDGIMNRPVKSPDDFDWSSVFGLYTLGKEDLQQRDYVGANEKLTAALKKDSNYLPALSDMAMLAYRNMDYKTSLAYASHALSIDTYDPAGNFYYGLASLQAGNITDAKDGFDIASMSVAFRCAAYTELSKIYLGEKDFTKALHYANKSLEVNSGNSDAYQTIALINRIDHPEKDQAQAALNKLNALSPLNHFILFEQYRWDPSESTKKQFISSIQNEMPHQSFLQLADWYYSVGQLQESVEVLRLAPENPEVYYWMAFLTAQLKTGDAQALIEKANNLSSSMVFPFRASSERVLTWVMGQSSNWKPKYYSALIHWSRNDTDEARKLFSQCGDPDFSPFYASRAELFDDDHYEADVKHAAMLEPNQWRYGKLLIGHQIKNKSYREALATANDYHKRFPADFRLSMLLAKALLLNKQYKACSDLLSRTTILPYEGATEGRQLYREAWLMQAVQQIQSKNYKAALASISKSKVWPENLGVGKPYDENIDSRVEDFLEATCYERTKKNDQAIKKWNEIVAESKSERHQITDFITALAMKKLNRSEEGEKLLKEWMEKQPENKMAAWAYAVYHGDHPETGVEENENFRIIEAVVSGSR